MSLVQAGSAMTSKQGTQDLFNSVLKISGDGDYTSLGNLLSTRYL